MKNKEHTRQVRDTVVKKFKAVFGYKKISQALNIPRSTVQAIILKWKEYQTTANLPRPGRPSKLSAHTRRRLIRDAAKRPMITLDELQRSTAEVGAEVGDSVHRTTISRILHKSGLYGRVARRKPFLKDIHKKSFKVCHKPPGRHQTCGRRCSGQMKPKLNFLATMQNVMFGVKATQLITLNTPSPLSNMVVAASWFGPAFLHQGQGRWLKLMGRWMPNTGPFWKKT
uniref:Transposase Tc1-like domain-containing protein n=1 Tax=Oncorhynchus tshawytscha TaxID=74940 RepID=A0AAZ3S4G8_ONCTS